MITEVKKYISKLRKKVLNEGVGTSRIVDAINDRKFLYIYYEGDDTVRTGYRVIRPYVLGYNSKTNNTLLRAWQGDGQSDGFEGFLNRRRRDHEYFKGEFEGESGDVPGWRLFIVEKIKSVYPIGKRFALQPLPPYYNPNDSQMTAIIASVRDTDAGRFDIDGEETPTEPTVVSYKDKKADVTKNDVEDLHTYVRKVQKRSPGNFIVYYDKDNNLAVTNVRNEPKLDPNDVVGNLKDLYNELVLTKEKADASFYNQKRGEIIRNLEKE